MVTSKFSIGQQVRHKLLGYLGVIVDADPEYSLAPPAEDEMAINDKLRHAPWYHVVIENEQGQPVQTYLAEVQLDHEASPTHPDQPLMDDLAESIKSQLQAPRLRN